MFGKKKILSLANPTALKKRPSILQDKFFLFGVSFAFGVLAWYLVRPILGM